MYFLKTSFYFYTESSEYGFILHYNRFHFGPATLQVLNSHMWPAATVLNSVAWECVKG